MAGIERELRSAENVRTLIIESMRITREARMVRSLDWRMTAWKAKRTRPIGSLQVPGRRCSGATVSAARKECKELLNKGRPSMPTGTSN